MCHRAIDTFYRRSFRRFIAISIFRMVPSPAKRRAISVSDDLIEATKTFRDYKSPRNDKIGGQPGRNDTRRVVHEHTRVASWWPLLFTRSHSTTRRHSIVVPVLCISYSQSTSGIQASICIKNFPLWIIIACETFLKKSTFNFLSFSDP